MSALFKKHKSANGKGAGNGKGSGSATVHYANAEDQDRQSRLTGEVDRNFGEPPYDITTAYIIYTDDDAEASEGPPPLDTSSPMPSDHSVMTSSDESEDEAGTLLPPPAPVGFVGRYPPCPYPCCSQNLRSHLGSRTRFLTRRHAPRPTNLHPLDSDSSGDGPQVRATFFRPTLASTNRDSGMSDGEDEDFRRYPPGRDPDVLSTRDNLVWR